MRILYCVLNWGLGHATRSIPVIRALQGAGFEVAIASDGGPLAFLKKTFPDCIFHELQSYNISYPTRSVFVNAVSQLFRFLRAVRIEKKQIDQLITLHHYNGIVSDNRYGCYHSAIPSILITHQLSNLAKTTVMSRFGEAMIRRHLLHFQEIWIPDWPDRALTGKMTKSMLTNLRFIGHLSDLEFSQIPKRNAVAAILSGPEPQRTFLENELLAQLKELPETCCLVRGIISNEAVQSHGNLTIYPYLDRAGVQDMVNSSEAIVCRTGYSSLMDLLRLGAKAVLIPTPGQPEQVYLGKRMKKLPQFVVQKQGGVNIMSAMNRLKGVPRPTPLDDKQHLLADAIRELSNRIPRNG